MDTFDTEIVLRVGHVERELPLTVEYTFHPASFGALEGGLPTTPDEPAYIEIHRASIELEDNTIDGVTYGLINDEMLKEIESEILNEENY